MAPLDSQRIRSNFSCHADQYDRYALVQQRVIARLAELFEATRFQEGICLEIGTGTGRLSETLCRRYPRLRPVLSDLAHGMTCHARQKLPALDAVDADAASLPFGSGCFPLVFSASVYQWVEDLPGAFREVKRVLKDNGLLLLALFGEGSLGELRQAHGQALAEQGRGRSTHMQTFPGPSRVAAALEAAGLVVEQLLVEDELEVYPDVPDLLRSLKRIGAGNASTERPPGLASRRVMQRMQEIYRTRHAAGEGVRATWQVIYVVAGKGQGASGRLNPSPIAHSLLPDPKVPAAPRT